MTKDNDGNWLAEFLIPAGQSILVKASLDIGISLTPIASFSQPAINMDANLMELPFWQTSDDKIQQYAKMYKTPRDIYNFVSRTLTYDYSRINKDTKRIGAKEILAAPTTALCMEFTDLFISIARAAGIPARRIVGYAYTNNTKLRPLSLVTDVLHAWPEYYDTEKSSGSQLILHGPILLGVKIISINWILITSYLQSKEKAVIHPILQGFTMTKRKIPKM